MPPVGAYVRPFRTVSDPRTSSAHRPVYVPCDDQSVHHDVASRTLASGSSTGRIVRYDGYHVMVNGTTSPALTLNSATDAKSSPLTSTGVVRRSESGPPTASRSPSTVRTHGTIDPLSKRIVRSIRMGTRPRRPSTSRTIWRYSSRGGMQSITTTVPSSVMYSV